MSDDYEDYNENEAEEETELEEVAAEGASGGAAPAEEEGRHLSEAEEAEQLTVSAKENLRRQMEEQMRKFLESGGQIQEVAPDVTADPPRKPESAYGSKPI